MDEKLSCGADPASRCYNWQPVLLFCCSTPAWPYEGIGLSISGQAFFVRKSAIIFWEWYVDMRHMAVQSANSWHYSGNRSKKGGLVMRQEMNGAAHGSAQGMAGNFRDSVLVFKNVRAIVIAGMLLALHIILAMVLGIYLTQTVKFSISFITNVVTGYLFGPWMALVTVALGDILQFVLKPVGGYFFGWTLNAAIGGLLYGLAFYKRAPREVAKEAGGEKKNFARVVDYLCMVIYAVMLAGWFLLPFLDVTTKAADTVEREVINSGTAFSYVAGKVLNCASTSPKTLAVVALVLVLSGAVFCLCRRRVAVILLGVLACLWMLLPVYNERAVLAVRPAFLLICVGFAAVVLMNLFALLREKSVDVGFLLRCFLTMLFVAVVVQMLLGTIWCVKIYGRGFWFYFVPRAIKSLIQLPFNTVLAYYVIRALKNLRVREIVR